MPTQPINALKEIQKAEYAIHARKYAVALELMQRVLSIYPENNLALYTIARVYLIQQKNVEAETTIREAIRLNPQYSNAHTLYALLLKNMQRYDEAEREFCVAIEVKATNWDAHFQYANFLLSIRKNLIATRVHCQLALEHMPEKATVHELYARLLAEEGNFAEAEKAYLYALSKDPNNAALHNSYGAFLLNKKRDTHTSFEHFRIALTLDPSNEMYRKNFFLGLKVKNPFYWLFLRYASLRRKSPWRFIFTILIAGVYIRVVLLSEDTNPALLPLSISVLILYSLFVLYIFTINPIFNFLIKRGWVK